MTGEALACACLPVGRDGELHIKRISMKQQADDFEVVVLGSELGGLIAAALLSYHNHKVLCLKDHLYRSSYSREGYRFTPFSSFSEKRLKSTAWKALSQALGLASVSHDQRQLTKEEARLDRSRQRVAFQVILPRARVDLFCRRPLFVAEWKREFPNEVGQIEKFYDQLDRIQHLLNRMKAREGSWSILPLGPPSLIKRWFSFKSLPAERMDEMLSPFSGEFRKFIQLQLLSWCNLSSERLPAFLASYLLLDGAGEEGAWPVEFQRVEKDTLARFIQSGGEIEEIEGLEKADIRWWKKKFTLTLKGEKRTIRSRFLILNSPLHHLSSLFGKKGEKFSRWRKRIRPRYALFPLFLAIDERVVPMGMKDLLVSILDVEKPDVGGNVLFLSLSREGDLSAAPEGKRALTVESLIPVEGRGNHSLDEHQDRVMRHLYHLFPFLENHIEFRDWSWGDSPISGWSYPHFVYETTRNFKWRKGVVPLKIGKNLYFVGKENFPYLGLEGEILGGLRVGKGILEKLR